MLKLKAIKEEFEKRGFKIGKEAVIEFASLEKNKIIMDIDNAVRKVRISGRKVVRPEDFEGD